MESLNESMREATDGRRWAHQDLIVSQERSRWVFGLGGDQDHPFSPLRQTARAALRGIQRTWAISVGSSGVSAAEISGAG